MLRKAKRAGKGESGNGRSGSAGVRDWYAAVIVRSCRRRILGSGDGSSTKGIFAARSLACGSVIIGDLQ